MSSFMIIIGTVNRYFFFLALFFMSNASFSQNQQDQMGNWIMYFGTNKIHEKLSIHTEIQYRNHTVAPVNTEQLLLRTGVNFHISGNVMASAGYAYVGSHQYGSEQIHPETEEHRIWEQFIMNNYVGKIKFEHRYRIEQRWVNQVHLNRFRYRLMLLIPINKPKIEKGTLFLGVYDEIFINSRSNFFDRNRLYGALGFQLNQSTGFQAGLLHQRLSNSGKGYFQFSLTINPDLRRKK